MAVPNIFANATTSIPLVQLDQNFATAITLGNTAVYLGNTTTTIGNVTLTNVTISSGNSTVTKETVTTITSPASTNLTIQSNSTTAITIDTSQNVGIGTASPSYNLHVKNGAGNCYSAVQYGTGTIGYMVAANNEVQFKAFNGTNDVMTFTTGATERMRITANGGVSFGSSGTAYGTSGQVLKSNGDAPPSWGSASATGALIRAPQFLLSGTSYTTPPTFRRSGAVRFGRLVAGQ